MDEPGGDFQCVPQESYQKVVGIRETPLSNGESGTTVPSKSSVVRVLVVDPLPVVREGLNSALARSSSGRVRIVGEADSIVTAGEAIKNHKPDVCLLGIDFTATPASEAVRNLVQSNRETQFVLFAPTASAADSEAALRYGAKGLYSRLADLNLLAQCIHEVHSGQFWFERVVTGRLLNSLLANTSFNSDAPGWSSLTATERAIAELVIAGNINKQIAAKLNMSNSTVAHHLTSVYQKLKLSDRTSLMIYARKYGLS